MSDEIPQAVHDIYAAAYKAIKEKMQKDGKKIDTPEAEASIAKQSWGAVANAGWSKDKSGKWTKHDSKSHFGHVGRPGELGGSHPNLPNGTPEDFTHKGLAEFHESHADYHTKMANYHTAKGNEPQANHHQVMADFHTGEAKKHWDQHSIEHPEDVKSTCKGPFCDIVMCKCPKSFEDQKTQVLENGDVEITFVAMTDTPTKCANELTEWSQLRGEYMQSNVDKMNSQIKDWKSGNSQAKPILMYDKFDHSMPGLSNVDGYVDSLSHKILPDGSHHYIEAKAIIVDKNAQPKYLRKLVNKFSPRFWIHDFDLSPDGKLRIDKDISFQHIVPTLQPADENAFLLEARKSLYNNSTYSNPENGESDMSKETETMTDEKKFPFMKNPNSTLNTDKNQNVSQPSIPAAGASPAPVLKNPEPKPTEQPIKPADSKISSVDAVCPQCANKFLVNLPEITIMKDPAGLDEKDPTPKTVNSQPSTPTNPVIPEMQNSQPTNTPSVSSKSLLTFEDKKSLATKLMTTGHLFPANEKKFVKILDFMDQKSANEFVNLIQSQPPGAPVNKETAPQPVPVPDGTKAKLDDSDAKRLMPRGTYERWKKQNKEKEV